MRKFDLIAFASSFVSFALERVRFEVKEVILFGSVARGDFSSDSDVDLFFDVSSDNKDNDNQMKEIISKFYKSQIFENWGKKGIKSSINPKIGVLSEWKLRHSILADGITLYGKYKSELKGEAFVVFTSEPIKNVAKRNKIIRALFGRHEKNQNKEGAIGKFKGKRLSPTVFIVPQRYVQEIISILHLEKVSYTLIEIWSSI